MKLKEEFKPCPLTIHGKVCLLIRSRPSHPAVLGPDSLMSSHENGIEEEENKEKENEANCKERKAEKHPFFHMPDLFKYGYS